ncbi:MAG: 4Fe-4S ferredoxin [Lentisphaerae bacterium GWF2_49_21]|nr:MAG: 4Fe-4S ferredoxin [Lentisphaerae bacterium GWF2_49_21]
MKRKIIKIDESKCNGCGLCVSACAESAIQLVNGKAKLVSDIYCDGLGACLGECPQGAIDIEEREASSFDEEAVKKHLSKTSSKPISSHQHIGCPGMAAISFTKKPSNSESVKIDSELTQWPLQLHLVPPVAPYWDGADLLISADCVPFAYANFHSELLKGRKLIIACPKLDNTEPYLEKLTSIIKDNNIKSVTAVRMEVPCCGGITMIAQRAVQESGKNIPFKTIVISIHGEVLDK